MPQVVQCPQCATSLRLPDTFAPGSRVKCPKCATMFNTPTSEGVASSPMPPPSPAPAPADGPREEAPDFRSGPGDLASLSPDYRLDLGPMFSEIGINYGPMLGPMVGYVAILVAIAIPVGFLTSVLGCIPVVGSLLGGIISALLMPHLMAGGMIVTLAQMRKQPWTFGDFFGGFRYWPQLFTVGALSFIAYWACLLPATLVSLAHFGFNVSQAGDPNADPTASLAFSGVSTLLQLAGFAVYMVLAVKFFQLAPYLVIDRKASGMEAIKGNATLSRGHFWSWLGLSLLFGLIGAVGILGCGVGVLFTAGLYFILMTALYLQVIRERVPTPQGYSPG